MRHKRALLGLAAAALWALLAAPAAFAAGGEVLYVAGNPALYPAEYYDSRTGAYEGALPALLARVGEEAGLEFVYIHPGADDQRAALAQNLQVEVVSGLTAGDRALDGAGVDEGPVIFTVQTQDGPMDSIPVHPRQDGPFPPLYIGCPVLVVDRYGIVHHAHSTVLNLGPRYILAASSRRELPVLFVLENVLDQLPTLSLTTSPPDSFVCHASATAHVAMATFLSSGLFAEYPPVA